MRTSPLMLLAVIVALSATTVAEAQPTVRNINVLNFEPTPTARGIFTADGSETLGHLKWYVSGFVGYAHGPLRAEQDGADFQVVANQLLLDVMFSMGFWRYFELGVHLPVVMYQRSTGQPDTLATPPTSLSAAAVGDLRFVPKVRFWTARKKGFGLAFVPQLTVPSGMENDNAGEKSATFEPKVVVDYRIGSRALVALNVGARIRQRVQVGDLNVGHEFMYSLGAEVNVWRKLSVLGEIYGAVGFQDAEGDADSGVDTEEAPLELLVGARYRFAMGLNLMGGVGVGLTQGYGSPDFRLFVGVGYRMVKSAPKPPPPPADRDGDGIVDADDRCPDAPEDKDGHADGDGCPDPDDDGDGVCDDNPTIQKDLARHAKVCKGRDRCPAQAEDRDGYQDEDGCPDPDNDGDGVCDNNPTIQKNRAAYHKVCKGSDGAPDAAEDKDGHQDDDGVPDPDNDGDGVCDDNLTIQKNLAKYAKVCKGRDRCPNAAEDADGHQDDDGCPDPDNDGDGFCDNNPAIQKNLAKYAQVCSRSDKCPNAKETINCYQDDDGCPDKGSELLKVSGDRIEILQKVYFARARARIQRRSYKLLRAVAQTIKDHHWMKKVRIEGHTDLRGRRAYNVRLSDRRANAVRKFLIKRGVEPSRLIAKGFGPDRPIRKGCKKLRRRRKRRACHAKNRRVEFQILKK